MSANTFRNALRVSGALLVASVMCLLLPRFAHAQNLPGDAGNSIYRAEISASLRLGYMSLDGGAFKPDGKVRGKDFLAGIKRGIAKVGLVTGAECKVENPNSSISRQQAVKMLVTSVFTPDQIELIGKQCGGAGLYLCDFADAGDVASWAEQSMAVAVYEGWISDRYRLYPKEDATREFIASLLARAFPDPSASTGLVVYVSDPGFRRAMSVQIVSDDPASEAVYPAGDAMPSICFSSAPGIVSFSSSLNEAKERRVGPNPLEVAATRVQKGKGGRIQVVLPASEAAKVIEADRQGLFLKTWRVAILAGTAPSVTTALRAQTPP